MLHLGNREHSSFRFDALRLRVRVNEGKREVDKVNFKLNNDFR